MKFVLFKLYHTQGLRYPPTEDQAMREAGCFLLAIKPTPLDADVGADLTTAGTVGMIETKDQGEHYLFNEFNSLAISFISPHINIASELVV